MLRLLTLLALLSQNFAWGEPVVDLVRVLKSEHKLQLISVGKVTREFDVALGGQPIGHKLQEGDGRTPEGFYTLDYKKSDSAFYRALHISYPNSLDIAAAKARGVSPGGAIMIHGQKNGLGWLSFISQGFDWTNGCIALTNSDMDIVWGEVNEGTKIEIKP
ncbi:MAG: L,D-transpeptidase family protein [Gallionella sp.]